MEKFKTRKLEIPTGKGREAAEALQDRLLLFEKVKNNVAFVNKEVYTPFKLEEGKESPLGLFAKSAISETFQRKTGEQRLEAWPGHERSALLGRAIFKDKQGRFYRDVDEWGIGHVSEKKVKIPRKEGKGGYNEFLDRKEAFGELEISEKFLSAGIRAPRIISIIELEEIIYGGDKISVEEARKRGIFEKEFQPAVEVRAFGTKARVSDIFFGTELSEETKKLMLEDAKTLVSQELGRGKNPLTEQEYIQWFAETLGKNVGLMHKNGWFHSNLSPHNITLDCRLCDFDTVRELKNEKQRNIDVNFAKTNSIQKLARWLDLPEERFFELLNHFQKSYDSVFPSEERKFINK